LSRPFDPESRDLFPPVAAPGSSQILLAYFIPRADWHTMTLVLEYHLHRSRLKILVLQVVGFVFFSFSSEIEIFYRCTGPRGSH
jgi:hypothetical protein